MLINTIIIRDKWTVKLRRRIQEKARLAKETIRKERQRLNRLNTVYIYLTVFLMVCLALLIVALKVGVF
jgi:hypothetical protein